MGKWVLLFLRVKGDRTLKKRLQYFTPPEWGLWLGSVLAIGGAYRAFDRGGWVTLAADGAQSGGINPI